MRYRLRTLVILLAVLPPMLAGISFTLTGFRIVASATFNGSQTVVCRSSPLGFVGISSSGKAVTANFGAQTVSVEPTQIVVFGRRKVPLLATWAQVELIQSGNDVQILAGKSQPPASVI